MGFAHITTMTMITPPEYTTMPVWRPEEDNDMTSRIAKDMAGLLHVTYMIFIIVKTIRDVNTAASEITARELYENRLQDL